METSNMISHGQDQTHTKLWALRYYLETHAKTISKTQHLPLNNESMVFTMTARSHAVFVMTHLKYHAHAVTMIIISFFYDISNFIVYLSVTYPLLQKRDFEEKFSPISTFYYINWLPNSRFPNPRSFSRPQKSQVWRYYCNDNGLFYNKIIILFIHSAQISSSQNQSLVI